MCEILWPTYLSGGQIEWYIGAEDQSLEDFRKYQEIWDYTWYARRFVQENLPFWEMEPVDGLLAGASTSLGAARCSPRPARFTPFTFRTPPPAVA